MKVSLNNNSQQNPHFGMFKATPEVAEKIKGIFQLNSHSSSPIFELNKDFLAEYCSQVPMAAIDSLLEKHPSTYVTKSDYWEIVGGEDSFAKVEELAAKADDIKPETQKMIEDHATIVDEIKDLLGTALHNADESLKAAGLDIFG